MTTIVQYWKANVESTPEAIGGTVEAIHGLSTTLLGHAQIIAESSEFVCTQVTPLLTLRLPGATQHRHSMLPRLESSQVEKLTSLESAQNTSILKQKRTPIKPSSGMVELSSGFLLIQWLKCVKKVTFSINAQPMHLWNQLSRANFIARRSIDAEKVRVF